LCPYLNNFTNFASTCFCKKTGCVKLHLLDKQYKNTELKVSYLNKELTLNNSSVNERRAILVRFIDPDGMDIWEMDYWGKVKWIDHSEQHTMYTLNKKGNRTEQLITIKDRSIFDGLATTGKTVITPRVILTEIHLN